MPAAPLSPPVPVLDQLAAVIADAQPPPVSPVGLLAVFAQVSDPRKWRGTRHRLPALLALATCAVLAGARSFAALGEWAADAGETVHALVRPSSEPGRRARRPGRSSSANWPR